MSSTPDSRVCLILEFSGLEAFQTSPGFRLGLVRKAQLEGVE
jgi:hypothetical protein